jgi:hypothetical protein
MTEATVNSVSDTTAVTTYRRLQSGNSTSQKSPGNTTPENPEPVKMLLSAAATLVVITVNESTSLLFVARMSPETVWYAINSRMA